MAVYAKNAVTRDQLAELIEFAGKEENQFILHVSFDSRWKYMKFPIVRILEMSEVITGRKRADGGHFDAEVSFKVKVVVYDKYYQEMTDDELRAEGKDPEEATHWDRYAETGITPPKIFREVNRIING